MILVSFWWHSYRGIRSFVKRGTVLVCVLCCRKRWLYMGNKVKVESTAWIGVLSIRGAFDGLKMSPKNVEFGWEMSEIWVDLCFNLCSQDVSDMSVICERILDDLGVVLMGFRTADRMFVNAAQFYHSLCAAERNDCIWGIMLSPKITARIECFYPWWVWNGFKNEPKSVEFGWEMSENE